MRRLIIAMLAGLGMALASCSGVQEKAENAANRSYTSFAAGKPYSEVASIGTSPLAMLAGNDRATFGPMIGATPLTNGKVIYRHIAPSAQTETSTSFGGIVGSSSVANKNRLSYFLVGPDGIVRDWATGQVEGSTQSCINYVGGLINRCADQQQVLSSLAYYDAKVLTQAGQPISSWGTPTPVETDTATN